LTGQETWVLINVEIQSQEEISIRYVALFIPLQGIVLALKSFSSRLTEKIIDNDNSSRASTGAKSPIFAIAVE
jgi:hypothetical protein